MKSHDEELLNNTHYVQYSNTSQNKQEIELETILKKCEEVKRGKKWY